MNILSHYGNRLYWENGQTRTINVFCAKNLYNLSVSSYDKDGYYKATESYTVTGVNRDYIRQLESQIESMLATKQLCKIYDLTTENSITI